MISVVEKVSNFDRMVSPLAIILWGFLFVIITAKNFFFIFLLVITSA
jgi:hypothetical protein